MVKGQYAMLSRQDNENIYLMYSDMPHFWYSKELIARPTYPWEFVQLGNCGSPIETEAGWLVLTHGVGPMRKYSLGAFLLDLDDPSRVVGRLETPLLEPNANEREGYVPNVVYSCGAVVHNGELVIPYAMSDYASTFATVPLDDVLNAMARPQDRGRDAVAPSLLVGPPRGGGGPGVRGTRELDRGGHLPDRGWGLLEPESTWSPIIQTE